MCRCDVGRGIIRKSALRRGERDTPAGRRSQELVFCRLAQAGERAAVVMSLIESAKLNGHDPWAYLKDVFERLPTLKQRDLAQLLPHNWRPASDAATPNTMAPAVAA